MRMVKFLGGPIDGETRAIDFPTYWLPQSSELLASDFSADLPLSPDHLISHEYRWDGKRMRYQEWHQ